MNNEWFAFNAAASYCMCYNGACSTLTPHSGYSTCTVCRKGGYCSTGYASGGGASSRFECNKVCKGKAWFAYNPSIRYCMCYTGACQSLSPLNGYEICQVSATRTQLAL